MGELFRRFVSACIPDAQTITGRALRWPLRMVPDERIVTVLAGPNRGFRWIAGASVHGCWIGTYEREQADVVVSHLSRGDVFYDIGANVGYYTLLASRRVGPRGRVVSFEPHPRNVRLLRRHAVLNELSNVEIVAAAVLESVGEVRFASGDGPSQGRVTSEGELRVRGISVDGLDLPPPDVLKVDVEGEEKRVLEGAIATLREHRPTVLLSTHGESLRDACYDILGGLGYEIRSLSPREADVHIASPVS